MAMMQRTTPDQRPASRWSWIVCLTSVLGLGVLAVAWPHLALWSGRAEEDHAAILNRLMAAEARVAPGAGTASAASARLERIIDLVFAAHAEGLGRPVERSFTPRWGVSFDADDSAPNEKLQRRVLDAATRLGLFAELDELVKDDAVFAPIPEGISTGDYSDSLVEPHAAFRQLARMNLERFRAGLSVKDPQAALTPIRESLALSRALGRRPLVACRLISLAIWSITADEVSEAVQVGSLRPGHLEPLSAEFAREPLPPWTYVLETERQFGHLALEQTLGRSLIRAADRGANQDDLDEMFDRFKAASAAPAGQRQAAMAQADARASDMVERMPRLRQLDACLPQQFAAEQDAMARLETLRGRLALERYRARNNALPATWAQLVPEFLSQPPTDEAGREIRYVVTAPASRGMGSGYELGHVSPGAGPAPISSLESRNRESR